jgi:outer membrane immunogenic protein
MRKLALAGAALIASTFGASAADLAARPYTKAPAPIAAVYNWTGFYIGAQVGYAWGDNSTREFVTATGLPTGFNQGFSTDGFVGGGHVGYNWQAGQFVFGLEGDVEGADINGGYRLIPSLDGTDFRLNFQASIRGRVGIAFNNSLLYVTGGAAFADLEHTYVNANTFFETFSATRTGWTVGAGWEYGFTPNWSARLEYRYTDFGTFRNASTFAFPGFSYEHDPVFHTVRGGISYRFGGPVVARY